MSEFLHMGGYGAFVWPAYLATILSMLVLGIQSWRRQKTLAAEVARLKAAARESFEPMQAPEAEESS